MRLQCPKCGTELPVDDDGFGSIVICTGCRSKLRAPVSQSTDDGFDEDAADEDDEPASSPPLVSAGGDGDKYQDLVDMTAMVDIVFFLLIFFMITSAAGIISCIGMPPPKQEGAATASRRTAADLDQDSDCVTVRIDEQNRIFVDDVEFPTETDLRDRLRSARAVQARKLLVKGHGNAHHGTLVMVIDLGHDIGFEDLAISIAKEEESQ